MIQVTLIRQSKKGKAVYGTLTFPIGERSFSYPSLENADFLIPSGTYPLERTWSPRFKKRLAEIQNVPERTGIRIHMGTKPEHSQRIHMGTKPEHSQGCILSNFAAISNLDIMFNYIEKNTEDEKVQIEIIDSLDGCA